MGPGRKFNQIDVHFVPSLCKLWHKARIANRTSPNSFSWCMDLRTLVLRTCDDLAKRSFVKIYTPNKFFIVSKNWIKQILSEKCDDYTKWSFETSGVYMKYSSIVEKRMSVRAHFNTKFYLRSNSFS